MRVCADTFLGHPKLKVAAAAAFTDHSNTRKDFLDMQQLRPNKVR